MEHLEKYTIFSDDRGSFHGISNRYTWGEVNFIQTRKNVTRGNHYHRFTKELFYILSGEVRVEVRNIVTDEACEFIAKPHATFIVDPYELHTFTTLEDSTWLNMLSHRMDDAQPDFYRLES